MPVCNLPARKPELSPAYEDSPTVSKTITYAKRGKAALRPAQAQSRLTVRQAVGGAALRFRKKQRPLRKLRIEDATYLDRKLISAAGN